MRSKGYVRNDADPCLYTCKAADGSLIVLVLYVDDMLIAGKSIVDVDALKQSLHETFAMKDFWDASHILGIRITHDCSYRFLFLIQKEYNNKVLERFHMEGGKAISTPLPPYAKHSHGDCPQIDVEIAEMPQTPYASAINSLMYAMVATRPHLAHAVGVVSKYMSNLDNQHWDAVRGKGNRKVQFNEHNNLFIDLEALQRYAVHFFDISQEECGGVLKFVLKLDECKVLKNKKLERVTTITLMNRALDPSITKKDPQYFSVQSKNNILTLGSF
ncbi:hypothetical protein L7F22_016366 [Adiantum nelumboides]|nr:hypothetical protein [Adiantum nelumboides]